MQRTQACMKNKATEPEGTCRDCVFFYITHDPAFPYGCRAMNFKGKDYPFLMVRAASGMACQMRQAKPQKKSED